MKNTVAGDIALPGKPFRPTTGANMGFGDADTAGAAMPFAPTSGLSNKVDAATVVQRKDARLDWVKINLAGG